LKTSFEIKHDYEFYVWLKSNLPTQFHIQSEPSSAYYSEWKFCYKLYQEDELLDIIEGDFRDLKTGTLVQKAIDILNIIEQGQMYVNRK